MATFTWAPGALRSTVGTSCPRLSSILARGEQMKEGLDILLRKLRIKLCKGGLKRESLFLSMGAIWTQTFAAQVNGTQHQDEHRDFLHEEPESPESTRVWPGKHRSRKTNHGSQSWSGSLHTAAFVFWCLPVHPRHILQKLLQHPTSTVTSFHP